jgi:hypothetical protein
VNVLDVWSMLVIVTVAFGDAAACRSSRIWKMADCVLFIACASIYRFYYF